MAMLAGALIALNSNRSKLSGDVYALFQPAEETGVGAPAVMKTAVFQNLKADRAFAFHNIPGVPLGDVMLVRSGVAARASMGLKISLQGVACHAAEPHEGRNPTLALARLSSLADQVPRGKFEGQLVPPLCTLVGLSVGEQNFGQSASLGHLCVTLRADTQDCVDSMRKIICESAQAEAKAGGFELTMETFDPFSETANDAVSSEIVIDAARAGGECHVKLMDEPFSFSEDFGVFTNEFSGAFIGLGAGEKQPPLHACDYDFPDELLEKGVELWCGIAAISLSTPSSTQ
jgi:metal-dependent amidase/aminoacylase/carboxypeptidase family protein